MTQKEHLLEQFNPEDPKYWEAHGKKIAKRNLWVSIPCLLLAFSTWMIWSAVAVNLNKVGFQFSQEQLFTQAAIPGLSGATLRLFYSFMVGIFGGKNWTIFSTATLLIPSIGIGIAVQDPTTPYSTMLILAALCGFGGGNFSSSMANISFFFPKKEQGMALGLNAGLGNLGVSTLQFLVPIVIAYPLFGGTAQTITENGASREIWLQNAAFIWLIPIVASLLAAIFLMDNLKSAQAPLKEQIVVLKRPHMWLTTWLYIMSFGSFIGYSAAFPLLIKNLFPQVNPLSYAFIGPLLGALIRPVGGWLSDVLNSGAKVTFYTVIVMIGAVLGVIYFIQPDTKNFEGFFACFLLLFTTTGIANGSVFRMIGVIFIPKEKAVVLGLSAAIAAYGAFILPKCFGWSIEWTGKVDAALYGFIIYYVSCLFLTWHFYSKKNASTPC